MEACPFYILDVFAERKYAGNQLAVVLDFGRSLSDAQMQAIALEMNYSETTFLLSDAPRDGGYEVRIFTPGCEVPFAGHPTIGTAYTILQQVQCGKGMEVTLNLKAGKIPVRVERQADGQELLWMHTLPPTFGRVLDRVAMADALGLGEGDLDGRFEVQIVSTGLPFPIVPVRSLEAIKRARCDGEKLATLLGERGEFAAAFLFCAETEDPGNQVHARMFAPFCGVAEDPATGSANSCLAGYLSRYEFFGSPEVDLCVEQGIEVNRPSRLYLRTRRADEAIEVFVGGKCVVTASGVLH